MHPDQRPGSPKGSALCGFFRRYRRSIDDLLEIASLMVGVAATREVLTALIGNPSGVS